MSLPGTVALVAWLAMAGAAARQEARPVVTGVVLRLPGGEDATALEGMVAVKSGQPLSLHALRRTVHLLYQLGRFSNVVVRALPAGEVSGGALDSVVLVIECLPKRTIRSVRFRLDGTSAALGEERLRKAAGLPVGEELYPGRLDAAIEGVRLAYERRGYRNARVGAKVDEELKASIEIQVREGQPTRVSALEIGPVAGLPDEDLRRGLVTVPGSILDLDVLDADVNELGASLRKAGYYRSRVGRPQLTPRDGDMAVSIPVAAGPRIEFRFRGNTAFPDAVLRANLGYDGELPLDAAAIEAAAERLRTFAQERGFYDARVVAEEGGDPDRVAVIFHVEEGRRYRLGRVRFAGAYFHDEAFLRRTLLGFLAAESPPAPPVGRSDVDFLAEVGGTPVERPARSALAFDPADVYYEPTWKRAIDLLVDLYRQDGFVDAAHEATRLDLDASRGVVDVEIRLREGVSTRVESIAFEGNQAISLGELARAAQLAPGDPFSTSRVERTRIALLDLYARRGFLYARVEEHEEISPDRRTAAIRYRLDEGPRVRIGNVVVAGARRTREEVVRGALTVAAGQPYDPEVVAGSQSALLRLGVFRSVALHLSEPEVPEAVKDMTVEVSERPWQTLSIGGGFSLANGPRVFSEYGRPNLFGRALEFSARAKVNYPLDIYREDLKGKAFIDRVEGRADVGLRYPRIHFLPLDIGAHVDAIGERLHRRAYDLGRGSAILGLDLFEIDRVAIGLQYELEIDNIRRTKALSLLPPPTQADVERLRFPEGITTLQSLRPVVAVDWRDNAVHPRRGFYASGTLDYSHSIGADPSNPGDVFIDMLKVSGTLSGYLPIGAQSVLALSARGGRVFSLSSASRTIGPKRFFMGGAASMRGYGEDEMVPEDQRAAMREEVRRCATLATGLGCSTDFQRQVAAGDPLPSEGGEAMLLFKGELRVPLGRSVEIGFFADMGNLWLDARKIDVSELRLNVGMGFRVLTPVGPAAFDLGFNVQPDSRLNERTVAPHFSIGLF